MNSTIQTVRVALVAAKQDPANRKGTALKTAAVRKVARDTFQQVKDLPKNDVFVLCEQLLDSGVWDERTIAFEWAFRLRKHYASADFARFEAWLARYVDGWGSCDDFCTHAFGYLVYAFPEHIPTLKTWTQSENQWERRAAAVVLIYGIRRGENFSAAFEIADLLLMDSEDLVQKGYGWMLKEISNTDPQPVFEFVMQRKPRMPRTALRYAIEKMPPQWRQQAMEK